MRKNKPNNDGICYRTKAPKMNVKADWQIKLGVIANTDREQFANDKEYRDYIEQHTQYAIKEQAERLKAAWAEIDKQTTPAN